jgi:SAM-dependent methyltransferase
MLRPQCASTPAFLCSIQPFRNTDFRNTDMSVSTDWWSRFFTGPVVESWRRALPPEHTRAEAVFLEEALGLRSGSRVLDVPCGHGRISIELAARGARVSGIDISTDAIAIAREEAAARGLDVGFEVRDMRDLPFEAELDAAFCFGNSFGYLDDAGNALYLERVAGALKPGGRFAMDTGYVAESLLPRLDRRAWYEMGGMTVLAGRSYDPRSGRLEVEYRYILEEGKVNIRTASSRIHTCREVVGLFERAGFREVECFGSIDRRPFELGSPTLILTATRS